jgi:hypothetical protein
MTIFIFELEPEIFLIIFSYINISKTSVGRSLYSLVECSSDRLCGLVVTFPGYRSRDPLVRFPRLPDFLRSSGAGTGSTQPHGDN